jgi:hypothetical protein
MGPAGSDRLGTARRVKAEESDSQGALQWRLVIAGLRTVPGGRDASPRLPSYRVSNFKVRTFRSADQRQTDPHIQVEDR